MPRLCLLLFVLALFSETMTQDNLEKVGANEQCSSTGTTESVNDQNIECKKATSIYEFSARDIHGHDVPLSKYRGHVCIIVNVASNCGLTDTNYKELVALYEKYGESKGLKILAFPSNQFSGQEPGSSEEILDFIKQYNVTFDVFEKVDVNGENAHPLWKWLQTQDVKESSPSKITWNFTKFIINKDGKVVRRFLPTVAPTKMESSLLSYF